MPLSDRTLEAPSPVGQAPTVASPHSARLSPGRSKRVRIQAFREVPVNTLKLQRLSSGRASPLKLPPIDALPLSPTQKPAAALAAGVRPSPRGPPPTSLLSSILGTNPLPLARPQPNLQPPPPTQHSSNQPDATTTATTPSADAPTTAAATATSTPTPFAAAPASAAAAAGEPAASGRPGGGAPPPLAFWSLRRPAVNPRTVELLMTREVLCLPPDLVSHDLPSCSELAAMSKLDWSDMEALLAECSC